MSTSKRWRELGRQIDALRAQFLPAVFDPLGQYSNPDHVQAHVRAFLLLAHAEVESFLEDWAKDIARAAERVWNGSGRATLPLVYLFSTHGERISVPDSGAVQSKKDMQQKLSEAAVKLFQTFYKHVNDNNGIKEANALSLLAPLGVPAAAFGATLLPNLSSFGALRGEHAHRAARAVTSVLDPETEFNRASDLCKDLEVLDEWLVAYKRGIR